MGGRLAMSSTRASFIGAKSRFRRRGRERGGERDDVLTHDSRAFARCLGHNLSHGRPRTIGDPRPSAARLRLRPGAAPRPPCLPPRTGAHLETGMVIRRTAELRRPGAVAVFDVGDDSLLLSGERTARRGPSIISAVIGGRGWWTAPAGGAGGRRCRCLAPLPVPPVGLSR